MVTSALKLKDACFLESYDKPKQYIKEQRHYFAKFCGVKDMVFPVVMYGCENRAIKKVDCWKVDAFEL